MGTLLRATGTSVDASVRSSVTHAVIAARRCLEAACVPLEDIALLINTGIYRDFNMMEPSMAALIQREIGLSLDYVKQYTGKSALSFDLMNGSSGALNAVQVAGAVLAGAPGRFALLVSSDAHPSNEVVPGFPYAAVGAAMLLERSDGDRGFGRVGFRTSMDAYVGPEGFIPFVPGDTSGRGRITITPSPDSGAGLVEWAAEGAREHAAAEGVDLATTLLVTAQCTSDFGAQLARRLGMDEAAAVRVTGIEGDPHTSSLALAYDAAKVSGQASRYQQVLFVAAGGGPTAAFAVYRP